MGGHNGADNYGYSTGTNKQWRQLNFIGRHTGEDLTHYTPPDTSKYWANYKATYKPPSNIYDWADQGGPTHDSIEKIYPRVMAQNADMADKIASEWLTLYQHLTDLMMQIEFATNDTLTTWQSDGADVFRSRGPGATLKSLTDWSDAAWVNVDGLSYLAGQIRSRQAEMKTLWSQYLNATSSFQSTIFTSAGVSSVSELQSLGKYARINDMYVNGLKSIENEYALRAQQIEAAMAADYSDVAGAKLGGGTAGIFEGPTNAVMTTPGTTPPPVPAGAPGAPGGGPGVPGGPLATAPAPNSPRAAPPAPKPAPPRPGAAPPAPGAAPSAPGSGPTAPGAPAPAPPAPGAFPTAPGAAPPAPGGAPASPGGGPGAPGAAPAAPAAPGAAPAAAPAAPGAAPPAPGLLPAAMVPPAVAGLPAGAAGLAPSAPAAGDGFLAPRPAAPGVGPGGVLGPNAPAGPGAAGLGGNPPAAPPGLTKVARPGQRLPGRPGGGPAAGAPGGGQPGTPGSGTGTPAAPGTSKLPPGSPGGPGQRGRAGPRAPGAPGASGGGPGRPGARTPGGPGLPPGSAGRGTPPSPGGASRRKLDQGEAAPPALPASFDELPVGSADVAPPVLDGSRTPDLSTAPMSPTTLGTPGARAPGATPPVLSNRNRPARGAPGSGRRGAAGAGRVGLDPLEEAGFPPLPPTIAPILEAPGRPESGAVPPVPPSLPGAGPTTGVPRGVTQPSVSAPAARKRKRKETERRRAAAGPVTDEAAWTVETPGGAVLDAEQETTPPPAAPMPTPRRATGAS